MRADHIGRPGFATDATGSVVWSVSYLPFGEVHVSTGSPIDARFPGQWYQAESGLYQNWMRDYDPSTGRYLEPDPLGLVDGASVYGYALQNPARWTDPTGKQQFEQSIEGLAAALTGKPHRPGGEPFVPYRSLPMNARTTCRKGNMGERSLCYPEVGLPTLY